MDIPQLAPVPVAGTAERLRPDQGTRGFTVNLSAVADAQALPLIRAEGFVAKAAAGAVFGDALQRVGGFMGRLADEQFQSINRRKSEEAQITLAAARKQIARLQSEEPDETKWGDIFDRESEKWSNDLLKDKSLSPVAREEIESQISAFRISGRSGTLQASATRSFHREHAVLEGGRQQALQDRDFPRAHQFVDKLERAGHLHPAVAKRQREEIAVAGQRAARSDAAAASWKNEEAAINADPAAYLITHKDRRAGESGAAYSRRIGVASQLNQAQTLAAMTGLTSGMRSGEVNPETIEQWTSKMPPHLAKWTQDQFHARHEAEEAKRWSDAERTRISNPTFIKASYASIHREVENFNRHAPNASNAMLDLQFRMNHELQGAPQQLEQLNKKLENKWNGAVPANLTSVRDTLHQHLQKLYDAETFGTVYKDVKIGKVYNTGGREEVVRPGEGYYDTRWERRIDPQASPKALAIHGDLMMKLDDYLANTKNVDGTAAAAWLTQEVEKARKEAMPASGWFVGIMDRLSTMNTPGAGVTTAPAIAEPPPPPNAEPPLKPDDGMTHPLPELTFEGPAVEPAPPAPMLPPPDRPPPPPDISETVAEWKSPPASEFLNSTTSLADSLDVP